MFNNISVRLMLFQFRIKQSNTVIWKKILDIAFWSRLTSNCIVQSLSSAAFIKSIMRTTLVWTALSHTHTPTHLHTHTHTTRIKTCHRLSDLASVGSRSETQNKIFSADTNGITLWTINTILKEDHYDLSSADMSAHKQPLPVVQDVKQQIMAPLQSNNPALREENELLSRSYVMLWKKGRRSLQECLGSHSYILSITWLLYS